MKHRIYMRDWYYNAGIVGFLRIISESMAQQTLSKIPGLTIEDNYIEFEDTILFKNTSVYRDGYQKILFDDSLTIKKIVKALGRIGKKIKEKSHEKKEILSSLYEEFSPKNKKSESGKSDGEKILASFPWITFGIDITSKKPLEKLIDDIQNISSQVDTPRTYDILKKSEPEYLSKTINSYFRFNRNMSKKVFGNILSGITNSKKPSSRKNNHNFCTVCNQTNMELVKLDNSISEIIAFNQDNTNWVWNCTKATEPILICPVCAVIYLSALASFFKTIEMVGKDKFLTRFYFVDKNTSISDLYDTLIQNKIILKTFLEEVNFSAIMKNTIRNMTQTKARSVVDYINFIEIEESLVNSSKHSRNYKIKNLNLDYKIAQYIVSDFDFDKFPKIFYEKIKKNTVNLGDELLEKTVTRSLSYSDLNRYLRYFLSKERSFPSGGNIIKFVSKIIQGDKMDDKVLKKAYANGALLRKSLCSKNFKNQIRGVSFKLLNALSLQDRSRFLSIYYRSILSAGIDSGFGIDEFEDYESFGYQFINGLTNSYYDE